MTRLTRRAALAGATALAAGSAYARGKADDRPNILLILADDWSWQGAEAIDRLHLNMPSFARLQREGANFTNAFAASPSCTASRGALLSGRWPWRLEEGANLASILPQHFPLYTEMLAEAGYHVGYAHKGWAPGQIAPAGRTQNPAGVAYADLKAFLARRPPGAPFAFWFGTNDPHRPYVRGAGVRNGIDPATLTVPPYLPDTPTVRSDIADYRFELERLDRETGEMLARLEQDGMLENTLIAMTGDNGWPFPRGKATLYEAGWHVPLALRWPKRVPAGRTIDAPTSLIDLAATFLDAAAIRTPGSMNARSLLPVAAGAASRDHVLGAMERHMDGHGEPGQGYPMRALRTATHLYIRNFHPERWPAGDPNRRPVDEAAIEKSSYAAFADIDGGPTKAELVLDQESPAVRRALALATAKRPAQELYDIRSDPFSLVNLADDPAHRALTARMDEALMRELRATGDPRALGGGDIFDRYPSYSDPGFERPKDF